MHVHLDPVGGVAGDMFVAALIDLFPDLAEGAVAAARTASLDERVSVSVETFDDSVLTGRRFVVEMTPEADARAHGDHHHVHWSGLRERLAGSDLEDAVKARALAIFSGLAEAEAEVHGTTPDEVAFHEVGAWDSIADIVAAAHMIEHCGATSWSVGALPLGSGRVKTAHGVLPVPAPATVLLLRGFDCREDGYEGERVTPTGAAILRNLAPASGPGTAPRELIDTGYGFGTRRFEGMSNVLRATCYGATASEIVRADQVTSIEFEIDDQTAEDLALALERLRKLDGVLDIHQCAVTGKQGRVMTSVRLLCQPDQVEALVARCFHETTTLGLRLQPAARRVLVRRAATTDDGLRVKVAERAGGLTAKTEIADVAHVPGHASRQQQRRAAEDEVLGNRGSDDESGERP